MAEEEFQESEILFRETVEAEDSTNHGGGGDSPAGETRNNTSKRRRLIEINIPEINVSRNTWFRSDFGGDEGEFVPPHVIIGRRVAGKVMAFSLCTGNGGTLKGRHLSEFRNSILRMTGFLET
ncbi:hypothetical protein PHJA_001838900 [Phtheirospermum japonicum]|uniref:Uncharacterized protein n=1 Tax=Phtheirospermum japonicum TaxID=374723 RepID=A0A830CID6_9LAMI|nr:hypothetical protein PHJA_001838900 [Phtheirospermum japonicum]